MAPKRNLSRDLHELARIEAGAEDTQRALERVQAALNEPSTKPIPVFPLFGVKLMRARNLTVIAAAAVIIFILTQSLSSHSNGNFAFAQVQEQVAKAKSVQYAETITDVLGEETQNQEIRRVVVLGNDLKHTDKNNKSIGKDGKEISNGPGHSIEVFDAKKEKLLILFPEQKEFVTKDYSAPAHSNTYKSGSTTSLYLQGGFYDLIRNVPVDTAKKLPAKSVNGKAAVGFLVEEKIETPVGTYTWQRTYWVDSTTKLPIRIEVKLRTTNAEKKTDVGTTELTGSTTRAQFDDVITDIAFDTPLDPALFRTDPPEGWTDLAKSSK